MIPVSLTIEGLYSYQERQTIDFEKLMAAGLFGIFGAVGSGKSSILEAITFALYGETDRMNSKENRNYNMMNLRCNRSYIEFVFDNHEQQRYKITRSFRRNSKKYDDVKPTDAVLYEWRDEDWMPLSTIDVEPIIGLNYENFKRTIIIPQGRFKEFLELKGTERATMLKEIFGLERFDLKDKASELYSQAKSELDVIQGQLIVLESVKQDDIDEMRKMLQDIQTKFETKDEQFKIETAKFQHLKNLRSDIQLLQDKEKQLAGLSNQQESIAALEIKLKKYEATKSAFAPLIDNWNKVQDELAQKTQERNSLKLLVDQQRSEYEGVKKEIERLEPECKLLPQKRIEEMEIQVISKIVSLQKEIATLNDRQLKGKTILYDIESKVATSKTNKEQIEQQLLALKVSKPDASQLMEVDQWYSTYDRIKADIAKDQSKIDSLSRDIIQILDELQKNQIDVQNYDVVFRQYFKKLETTLNLLREKATQIELQRKLADYAQSVIDGVPCPLCGSTEHPSVLHVDDVSQDHQANNTAIEQVNHQIKLLQDQKSKADQQILFIQQLESQKQTFEKEIQVHQSNLKSHQAAFKWKNYDVDDSSKFQLEKENLKNIEQEISKLESSLLQAIQEYESELKWRDDANKLMDELRFEAGQKDAQIQQYLESLQLLNFETYSSQSQEELSVLQQHWKQRNDEMESQYHNATSQFQTMTIQLVGQENNLKHIGERIKELSTSKEKLHEEFQSLLFSHQLKNLDEAKAVIDQNLNVTETRDEIESFKRTQHALEVGIKELHHKLQGVNFSEQDFQEKESSLIALETEHKSLAEKLTTHKSNIARLETDMRKKLEWTATFELVSKRTENLKILLGLFQGAGFMNYVSFIYLRQLCDAANVRFHRLTRNQLSLQVNDKNDFEVIDYLNDGRRRSVKTLSGGQGFQASLSLALALAESVPTNAKAERNFFFIDEGFGTQDAESIDVVFETLMHLQKEHRIVGIISHVDELKEKIPVSLTITKNEESGSKIKGSWEV